MKPFAIDLFIRDFSFVYSFLTKKLKTCVSMSIYKFARKIRPF